MSMKFNLLRDFFISIILSFLYNFFLLQFSNITNELYRNLCAIFLAISSTVVLVMVGYFVYGKMRILRCIFNPLGRFEGVWVCNTGIPERPVSIFEIRYDAINHCYIYFGHAYDCMGNYRGDWNSQGDLVVENNKFRFYATGHFVDDNENLCSTESSGYIILRKYKSDYTADGYTVDWCSNNNCFKTTSEKITKKFLREKLRCKLYNSDTRRKLVEYYCKMNCSNSSDRSCSQTDNMHVIYQNDISVFQRIADHEDYNNNLINYLNSLVDWNGKTVFEAGVGTGRILENYINHAKFIYLSDRSKSMLDYIKLRFSKFENKLQLFDCDHIELQKTNVVHQCDVFISTYSFGHAFIDGIDSKETYKKLMDNCKTLVKSGGMIIIAENQSILGSQLSYDRKLGQFFNNLISDGFSSTIIDTDYKFSDSNEAFSVMNPFFGDEVGEKIKSEDLNIVPEKTIVFYKSIK